MHWDSLTSVELAEIDRSIPVLLPLAATEQHGPHLPLATDRMIADHLSAEIDRALPNGVLTLPTVAIGCSLHHMAFPGTLSLSHESFRSCVIDTLESAAAHGFRRFFLLNAHGGNQSIGGVIAEQFGNAHPECRIAFASWWQLAREKLSALSTTAPGGVGHACEFETSLLLHIAPDKVRRDKVLERANQPTFAWAEGDMLRSPRVMLYRGMLEMTPTGVFGEPVAANPELGRAIVQAVTDALIPILRDLSQ